MYYSQNSRSNSGGSSFWLGLVCGAAAGAAAAVLFAPKPGVHMRRDVTDGATRLRQAAQDKYSQATDMVGDMVDRGRRAVVEGKRAFLSAKPNGAVGDARPEL